MIESVPGGAPAPVEPSADNLDLSKFFGTVEVITSAPPPAGQDQVPAETAQAETVAPAGDPPPPPEAPPAPESEIAAALRAMREDRARETKIKEEATSWKAKFEQLQATVETERSAPSFETDPLRYVRARKLTPEQQLELGKTLLYDLAPEKAPEDFRFRVFEARQKAREEEQRQAHEAERAAEAQAAEARQLHSFLLGLDSAASTFTPGAYPASEDWYGDNRQAYVTDLFHLANAMAEEAASQGKVADLRAENLAAMIEQKRVAELEAITTRRSKRSQAVKPATASAVAPSGMQTTSPASTQGMRQGGPRPPALTDEERIERAMKVAFGTP